MVKLALVVCFLMINGVSNQVMAMEEEGCVFNLSELINKFYTSLYKAGDYKLAEKVLDDISPCVSTKYQAAVVADLSGDLLREVYKSTKDPSHADKAEDIYLRGLKFNTEHNEVILWHLGLLMREKKEYESAIGYVNRVLQMKPEDPVPYLATALMLSVDVENWEQAKELVAILINKKRDYYFSFPVLFSTVKTLCYHNRPKIAQQFVRNVEKYRKDLNPMQKRMLEQSKAIASSCYR